MTNIDVRENLKSNLWTWLGDWVVGREPPRMDRFLVIHKTGNSDVKIKIIDDNLDAAIDQVIERFGSSLSGH